MEDVQMVWSCCIVAVGIVGIVANAVEIYFVYRSKKKTIFEVTIVSLGVADLLTSLMFIMNGTKKLLVLHGLPVLSVVLRFSWAGCYFSTAASFIHIIFIAVQRLFAVLYPMSFKMIFTRNVMITAILSIWVLSAGFGGFSAAGYFPSHALSFIIFICGGYIILLYIAVCYHAQRRRRQRLQGGGTGCSKAVFMHSVGIMLAFVICTFPYGGARFYSHSSIFYAVCDIMFSLNPSIDPVLYFLVNYCRKNKRVIAPSLENVDATPPTDSTRKETEVQYFPKKLSLPYIES